MLRTVVACLALLVLAPAAPAATLRIGHSECDGRYGATCLTPFAFEGEPGEANDIEVAVAGSALVFHDRGAPFTASVCPLVDPHTASCPVPEGVGAVAIETGDGADVVRTRLDAAQIALGPGDDRFTGTGYVDGGPGADVLRATGPASLAGGEGDDELTGSAGADALGGGPGHDVVRGLDGDDAVQGDDADVPAGNLGFAIGAEPLPDHAAGDRLDGGRGRDVVSWARRRTGVRVAVGRGRAGTGGEVDRFTGFEAVHGSAGPDVLVGTDGPDELRGLRGDDVLIGRGGDDVLYPSQVGDQSTAPAVRERDVVRAGAGADRVLGPGAGRLSCGSGVDVVDRRFRGGVMLLPADCETLQLAVALGARSVALTPARRLVDGRLALRLRCPVRAGCHVHVSVRRDRRSVLHRLAAPFGTSRARVRVPGRGRVRLDLRAFPDGAGEPARVALDVR